MTVVTLLSRVMPNTVVASHLCLYLCNWRGYRCNEDSFEIASSKSIFLTCYASDGEVVFATAQPMAAARVQHFVPD